MRPLHPIAAALAAACALVLSALPAAANLLIEIDKSAQVMTVSQDGARLYTWPVSTGQRGYDTPSGQFKPFRMEKDHFSREWDDAPMPHSIFFTMKGHAIHGTEHTRNIGRPASHGCVRLEPENARTLFGLVKEEGMANTRVVLFGEIPRGGPPAVARRAPQFDQPAYNRPGYGPRGDDDRDVTGSVPRRRIERVYPQDEQQDERQDARQTYPRDDRPIYWGQAPRYDQRPRYEERPRYDDDRDARYRRPPPPPFFLPGPRYGWD